VLDIIVHPLIAGDTHLVTACLRIVVEGGTHTLSDDRQELSKYNVIIALARGRSGGDGAGSR
jgi:hypothetical protein